MKLDELVNCVNELVLFPNDDTLTQKIESWKDFANALRGENTDLFLQR